ncbi:hypothetical protein [Nonomuraea angiospora]|uniref:hypothetical protein n=1 Tax=Nonomuraea angiospora TaxID=46172 RepID=UPI0029A928F0|nr:hypothetical protein [Nonomuraea angiospora]MDX3099694.1 hypothetical protein [Nonomuraea angiospora]
MSEPEPMGPTQHDPAVQAGYASQQAYVAKVEAVRSDPQLSELAKAEAVVGAYEAQNAELQRLNGDLYGRRQARYDHLRGQMPVGAGVAPDASPADAAVLHAAFRTSLEKAREARPEQRKAMLAEAMRFGDQVTVRAIITAAEEVSDIHAIDAWAASAGKETLVAELRDLNTKLNGHDMQTALWEGQAFRAPRRPAELGNLPSLRKQAQEEEQAQMRQRRRNPTYY